LNAEATTDKTTDRSATATTHIAPQRVLWFGLVTVAAAAITATYVTGSTPSPQRAVPAPAATKIDPLAMAVAQTAGPGTDEGFSFGTGRKSGPFRLSAPTEFYVACTNGTFIIGSLPLPCDGSVHRTGPYGHKGLRLTIATTSGHWAFLARSTDHLR
jgi:hypothetical protein